MRYYIKEQTLKDIANAIRAKGNTTALIKVSDLDDAILALVSGGGKLPVAELVGDDCYLAADGTAYRYDAESGEWAIDETIEIVTEAEEGEIGAEDNNSGYKEGEIE